MCREQLPTPGRRSASTELSGDSTIAIEVVDKELVSTGVVRLRLVARDRAPLPPWTPGSHIDLVIDGLPIKQYSLCGDPADSGSYTIGVLLDENGSGTSRYVHHALQVGGVVQVRGPRNHFTLVDAPHYVFIAGGIGITPIIPMIREVNRTGRNWKLYFAGRRRASMAFLDDLASYGDRVAVIPKDELGALPLEDILGVAATSTLVYCCGPEPLLVAAKELCAQSWPDDAFHFERFAPRAIDEPLRSEAFTIELAQSGLELEVPAEESILSIVQAAGVDVAFSCSEGICGTCETRVLGGSIDHRDSVLTEYEQAAGDTMMICVSRAQSDRLVLDL